VFIRYLGKTRSNLGKHFLHPQKDALPYTHVQRYHPKAVSLKKGIRQNLPEELLTHYCWNQVKTAFDKEILSISLRHRVGWLQPSFQISFRQNWRNTVRPRLSVMVLRRAGWAMDPQNFGWPLLGPPVLCLISRSNSFDWHI